MLNYYTEEYKNISASELHVIKVHISPIDEIQNYCKYPDFGRTLTKVTKMMSSFCICRSAE